ncbi:MULTISPECIES: YhcN/YlaJ family sporulation lipoprotein [Paenibacillus]|uniref:YhcN/YlaJ family sporulation lipoprotein n=1 Tax=Paenibacillus TaxID=44249 RepID=UPI001F47C7CD|nr:YhcN/YlaJ family sporulation lipoprotein [Paenibacillus sp. JJ-223]CAH1209083.1 hypothetical protein PAECIP111890_03259 [Paenibacillus sp. JJ-223]
MKGWICALLLIFILTGCSTTTRSASQEKNTNTREHAATRQDLQGGTHSLNTENRRMESANTHRANERSGQTVREAENVNQTGKMPHEQRITHLKTLAKKVEGVRDANCVIFGNTAIVGIDVDGKLDRARVGTIKYSVAEALRKDPEGVDSIVTADADVSERIKEIGEHIRKGNPVSGFASELSDIVGRIIPQLPKDVKVRQNPNENVNTERHMQQLHSSDRKQQKAQ